MQDEIDEALDDAKKWAADSESATTHAAILALAEALGELKLRLEALEEWTEAAEKRLLRDSGCLLPGPGLDLAQCQQLLKPPPPAG